MLQPQITIYNAGKYVLDMRGSIGYEQWNWKSKLIALHNEHKYMSR
jgi:hypothetical protein